MAELQVGLQKFSTDLRNVRDATSRNASSMQGLQSEIVNTKGIVDHTRENVDSARTLLVLSKSGGIPSPWFPI